MLDCGHSSMIWQWFSLLFPHMHLLIWPNLGDLSFIRPQCPLPVLHSPIFMIMSRIELSLVMCLLKHGDFLLCCRPRTSLLQCISDSLRINRTSESVVNELGSLNSIIKLSRSDLTNYGLYIMSRKFRRMTTMIVLLSKIEFFVNFANSTKANTSLGMYLMMGIALDKQKNNRRVFGSRRGLIVVVRSQEADHSKFNILTMVTWPCLLFLQAI